jgi:hypothetical protein
MKEQFKGHPELSHAAEFIHFACTSEDANNVAQATATPNFTAPTPFSTSPQAPGSHDIRREG